MRTKREVTMANTKKRGNARDDVIDSRLCCKVLTCHIGGHMRCHMGYSDTNKKINYS